MRYVVGFGLLLLALGTLRMVGCAGESGAGGSGGTGAVGGDGGSGVVSPSNEALALLSLSDGEVTDETLVVADQVLITVEEDTTENDIQVLVDAIAAEHPDWGLTRVGGVDMIRMIQLAFDNLDRSAEEQAARLEAVIARLASEPVVVAAGINHLMSTFLVQDMRDDNSNFLNGRMRCAFAAVDYYQAYAVFREVLPHVSLHAVKVAVVDTDIDSTTGQFDDIQPRLEIIAPASPVRRRWRGHGTLVAGIIAADNDGQGFNGLALPLLGNRLSMQFVFSDPYDYEQISAVLPAGEVPSEDLALAPIANMIDGVRIAVENGADVVNLSFGAAREDGLRPLYARSLRQMWWDLITHPDAGDTLFVAAAPNYDILLTGQNSAPGGLTNPADGTRPDNLVTVGGVESCNPTRRWSSSARGDLVEAAAPASPVLGASAGSAVHGNSYAAPMVSSIAAIAHSINPAQLSGAALKNLLVSDDVASLPVEPPFQAVRPTLMFTVGRAILAHGASSPEVDRILDSLGGRADDIPDPTGWVGNRAFGQSELSVAGPGYSSQNDIFGDDARAQGMTHENYGVVGPGVISLNLTTGSDTLALTVLAPFQLYRAYTIGADADAKLFAGGRDGDFAGSGESGTVTFTNCELTTRSLPLDHFGSPLASGVDELVYVQLQGTASGSVLGDIDSEPPQLDVEYEFSTSFETAFQLIDPPAATTSLWEEQCVGGFGAP